MIFLYEKKKPDFFSSSKTSSKCIFVVDLFFPFFVLLLLSSLVSFSLPQQHQLTQCWGRKKYKIFEKKNIMRLLLLWMDEEEHERTCSIYFTSLPIFF